MEKKYDYILAWPLTKSCQLRCDYCFFSCDMWGNGPLKTFLYRLTHKDMRSEPVEPVEISATMDSLRRISNNFFVKLGGGEPFIVPNIIELCVALTQEYSIALVSNLVAPKVRDFVEKIAPDKVEHVIASAHQKELTRLNLHHKFIDNLNLLHNKGFNVEVHVVVFPSRKKEIEEYVIQLQKETTVPIRYVPFRGKHKGSNYPEAYTQEEILKYSFTEGFADVKKYIDRGELCEAGHRVARIDFDGTIYSCYGHNEKLGNLYSGFSFKDQLTKCDRQGCACIFFNKTKLIKYE